MKSESRNLADVIKNDLKQKFVFLSGPRQVGKTTLAKKIIDQQKGKYLLYDDYEDRRVILNKEYVHHQYVCLDEFHKFPRWKNHLKGTFDKYHETLHLILTGSARLDVYQKSGDSLFGRYYLHHLHPLTLGEIHSHKLPGLPQEEILESSKKLKGLDLLMRFGGFPEPFYKQSEIEHRRWQNMRRQLLVKEDMRDLTQIQLIDLVEQLMLFLPERIGSLFSFNSLAEDIQVAPPTIKKWMQLFERLFIVFKVMPYSKNITRSIKKQPKYFLYDWSEIQDEGARFENLVASHLWKATQVWSDIGLGNIELYFIRDRDRREADFLLVKDKKPWFLVECKLADTKCSENLYYFSKRLNVPACQLILKEGVLKKQGQVTVISADSWLGLLP